MYFVDNITGWVKKSLVREVYKEQLAGIQVTVGIYTGNSWQAYKEQICAVMLLILITRAMMPGRL